MFVSSGSGPHDTHSIGLGYQQSTNNSVGAVFEIGPLAGSEFVSLVSRVKELGNSSLMEVVKEFAGMCHCYIYF